MFRFIAELLCCITPYQEIPEPVIRNLFPGESYNAAIMQEFDQVYNQYAPRIMKELGVEVQEFCWQDPADPRAQFINRYVNVFIKRLAITPVAERENELEALKVLIPANKGEHDYIWGDMKPVRVPAIGKQECWPLHNREIHNRINDIRDMRKAKKANHPQPLL